MYCRNRTSYEHFKLKRCSCAQSHALGTRTKFQLEILTINVITSIIYFREIILESSRDVNETTPWPWLRSTLSECLLFYLWYNPNIGLTQYIWTWQHMNVVFWWWRRFLKAKKKRKTLIRQFCLIQYGLFVKLVDNHINDHVRNYANRLKNHKAIPRSNTGIVKWIELCPRTKWHATPNAMLTK